jgi:hypothetical protein
MKKTLLGILWMLLPTALVLWYTASKFKMNASQAFVKVVDSLAPEGVVGLLLFHSLWFIVFKAMSEE